MKQFVVLVGVVLSLAVFSCRAYALSFRLYDTGAKAQAQAGAYSAQASDASAIYYNPAGLTWNPSQVISGIEFLKLDTDYTNLAGLEESSDNNWEPVPHEYISYRFNDRIAAGFGVFSVFGLASNYDDTGLLRYVATSSELRTINMASAVAYQVNPHLSIAAGLDVLSGELDLRRKVDFGALAGLPGAADGNLLINADGTAVGFNVGLIFEPNPQHRVGLMLRSPIDLELDGSSVIADIPAFVGVGSTVTGDLSTEIDLPMIVRAGYAYSPSDRWTVEADLEWTDFSTFDELNLVSTNPLFPSTVVEENHDDSYVVAVGTSYDLNPKWTLRGGYGHVFEAVPESTFTPVIPGSDRNFFTFGLGWRCCSFTIDLAYQFIIFDDRDIDNSVGAEIGQTVDGEYESTVHGITIDVGIKL